MQQNIFKTTILVFIFLTSCSEKQQIEQIYKSADLHKIGNYFYAYFPQKPVFFDSYKNDIVDHTFYAYEDYDNLVFYNAAYGLLTNPISKSQRIATLKDFANGEVNSTKGHLIKSQSLIIDNENAIIFSYTYEASGLKRLKYKAVILLNNTICSWGVHGIIDKSDQVAKDIFYSKLKFFEPIK
jgi:hypothetical protein